MDALCNSSHAVSFSSSSASSVPSSRRVSRYQLAFTTYPQRISITASLKLSPKETDKVPSLEPYLKHSKLCNSGSENKGYLVPFLFEGRAIGYVHPKFLDHLEQFSDVFSRTYDIDGDMRGKVHKGLGLAFQPTLTTKEERTAAVNLVVKALHYQGLLPRPRGELYSVSTHFGGNTVFSLDRSYAPYFGVQGYAVHVNGYVEVKGEKNIWVGKRSSTKSTYPGYFDQLAAGGLPEGLSCEENAIKECWEEAGIPREVAEKAISVSVLSYEQIKGLEFERYLLFCYDLQLSGDFRPQCTDGEVERFELLSVSEIKTILETSEMFKPSCAIVTIDFLIRNGMIKPEQEGYLALIKSLRIAELPI